MTNRQRHDAQDELQQKPRLHPAEISRGNGKTNLRTGTSSVFFFILSWYTARETGERWIEIENDVSMKRILYPSLLFCLTVLQLAPLNAQKSSLHQAVRTVTVLEVKGGLNSDKQQKLAGTAQGIAVNPSFGLVVGDRVQVISRQAFERREEVMDTVNQRAFVSMTVRYECVYLKAVNGPNKDREGWAVLSREAKGQFKDVFLESVPEGS